MKKAIISVGVAIVIFLLGWFFSEIKSTETWSDLMSFQHEIELEREANKAFESYQKEKPEVGIHSLIELLNEIDHREEVIGTEKNASSFRAPLETSP
jgi:hypothetical protein